MTHGHHAFLGAVLDGHLQRFLQQRNQRGFAFQREALGSDVKRLQHLLEDVGFDQLGQDALAIHRLGFGFHALAHPVAPLRVGHVHEFGAHGAAVHAPRLVGHGARQVQLRMLFSDKVSERVQIGPHVAPTPKSI